MDPVELEMQVAATRAFILADPEDLVFLRASRISDGAGGFLPGTQVEIATQTARLIPQSDKVPEVTGSDGRHSVPEWILLMEPDADLKRYDRFSWGGNEWEVAQIHLKPVYELKGDVIRCGSD